MRIPVFYSPSQTVQSQFGASPSARKPAEVLASWQAANFPIKVLETTPATVEELCLAHNPDFVQGILSGKYSNGFGNRSMSVANSLPWTTGSFLSAARHVLKEKLPVAVSPSSGYHHAEWNKAQGFCTFNGLMVTALALKKDKLVSKVGILDCDQHYGNGTDNIIKKLGIDWIHHYTFGSERRFYGDGEAWLGLLPQILDSGFDNCDVILYQAGADPHVNDPFGGTWTLTTERLARRDEIVFSYFKKVGRPIVWNLAGGYQEPLRKVLDIHDNTMKACSEIYRIAHDMDLSE